jgi:hypothetical protein
VAVGGTLNTIVKFTSTETIGDTTSPITEVTGGTRNTIVIGSATRTTQNAVFEVYGSGGIMFPRLTETQRNDLIVSSIDVGLIVYQSNGDEGLYIYKSGGWVQII